MENKTIDELKDLCYDPETGEFSRYQWVKVKTGCVTSQGRLVISNKAKTFSAGRVAWAIYHGKWPSGEIDHINRNPLDNRIVNLREATKGENCCNKGLAKNNMSGHKNVHYSRRFGTWHARVTRKGKMLSRTCHSLESAIEAAKELRELLHGRFSLENSNSLSSNFP